MGILNNPKGIISILTFYILLDQFDIAHYRNAIYTICNYNTRDQVEHEKLFELLPWNT